MAITRANTEAILIKRAGKLMAVIGLDGTTVTGANADLNDPIGYALRQLGYSVASVVAVADADLAAVSTDDYDALFDVAEYRVVETICGNWNLNDIRVLNRSESLSQLNPFSRLEYLRKKIADDHGVSGAKLQTGMMTYDLAEEVPTE